ncbi:MAG TPA: head maturation protease, ClpP-related [Streptosporangiaceae bacterium]|nr:head maturation protease, ClpP-related [Streptosporangiaceae bacterium]
MSKGWYIANRAVAAPAQVTIYDEIGCGGVRASALLASLDGAREVDLRISSEGGDVFEAVTIYNRLAELDRVQVTVDGLAASAASVIAMAASPGCLAMAPRSRMMVHEAWAGGPSGTAAELAMLSAVLDGLSDEIAGIYAHRSGRPASYWRGKMRAETWFTAEQAVAGGLADYVTGPLGPEAVALVRWQVRQSLREVTGRG